MLGRMHGIRVFLQTGFIEGRADMKVLRGMVSKVIRQDVRAGFL